MSYHKARENNTTDPNQPNSTVMHGGRFVGPNESVFEESKRSAEEEKQKVQEYHEKREKMKKSQAESFDAKTGKPIEKSIVFEKPEPVVEKEKEKEVEKKPVPAPVPVPTPVVPVPVPPKVEDKK